MNLIDFIPYLILFMTFWDFSIHLIDKRDRKYFVHDQPDKMWSQKLKKSKNIFSYYYPHFWGKNETSNEKGWQRYDYFWLIYWGIATVLLIIYINFK